MKSLQFSQMRVILLIAGVRAIALVIIGIFLVGLVKLSINATTILLPILIFVDIIIQHILMPKDMKKFIKLFFKIKISPRDYELALKLLFTITIWFFYLILIISAGVIVNFRIILWPIMFAPIVLGGFLILSLFIDSFKRYFKATKNDAVDR
jgi:hypothetical protein